MTQDTQQTTTSAGRKLGWLPYVIDLLLVLLFVLIGRRSHGETGDLVGLATTAWPFAAAVTVMWLVTRAWRHPQSLLKAGLPVWAGTVALGMLLRVVTGGSAAVPFIIVATVVLAAFLLGWRAIAALVDRIKASKRAS